MTPAEQALRRVLRCAWDGLEDKPALAFVAPGTSAAWDSCCDGMLWVRLTGLEPFGTRSRCSGWTASIEVGIIRCCATVNDAGEPPTAEQMMEDASQEMDDMTQLMSALSCCPEVKSLGAWSPLGPDGGCAGGQWTATVHIPHCEEC